MKPNQIQWSNISIPCLLKFVLRNLWMVAASAVILAMSASLYLNWVHIPQYQASMTYAVAARQTSYSSSVRSLNNTRPPIASIINFSVVCQSYLKSTHEYCSNHQLLTIIFIGQI